ENRDLQKQLNDLNLERRTVQIELNRKGDQIERAETSLKNLQVSHRELQDIHRTMRIERDKLREDVQRSDDRLAKETGLRKSLQRGEQTLMAQISELTRQRFEREEEIEKLKSLLQAQEQHNAEQRVTVDKYHAMESEMKLMQ
ncbi:unnamed protein product, partial [Symbiodinium sp. CCMP2592]